MCAAQPKIKSLENSYPLSMLFLTTAAIAIVMSMHARQLQQGESRQSMETHHVVAVALVEVVGLAVGSIIGAHHFRRLRGATAGGVIGLLTAALIAPLTVQGPPIWTLLPSVLLGSLLLIGLGAAVRLLSGRRASVGN